MEAPKIKIISSHDYIVVFIGKLPKSTNLLK